MRNHFLVYQILKLVLEVDAVLGIMSNVVRVIHIPLRDSIEFGTSIHWLRPHRVNASSHNHSLLKLYSSFSERGKDSGGLLL